MKSKKKFFKKRQSKKSSDKLNVHIHSSRNLSEEQKKVIESIVKDGLKSKIDAKSLLKDIYKETGIYSAFIFFDKDDNDLDVYF